MGGTVLVTNYVLIDLENVRPKSLHRLNRNEFRVFVFVGANQANLPFELVESIQKLGNRAEYIRIAGSGRNALDFHIAFYLGELSAADPAGNYFVVSKDKGFDLMIEHARGRKKAPRLIARLSDLDELPALRIPNLATMDEKLERIVANLRQRGTSRPRKVTTLSNTIATLFSKNLKSGEISSLLDELAHRKVITVNGTDVKYMLPPD